MQLPAHAEEGGTERWKHHSGKNDSPPSCGAERERGSVVRRKVERLRRLWGFGAPADWARTKENRR